MAQLDLGSVTGPQGPKGDIGATGPQGPTGATGATGATGTQGIQGKSFNTKGDWVSGIAYVNNTTTIDVVSYNGSSYACKTSHTASASILPTNTTYWQALAQKGDTGAQGSTGATGAQGPIGATGPTGATGAQGVKGDTGAQGIQGVQGIQGKSFSPCGDWVSGTVYTNNATTIDVVTYNGSGFTCKASHTASASILPTNTTYWQMLVQKGDTGAQGPTGATGAQGPTGAKGDTGAQGATGPQGATGATGQRGSQWFSGTGVTGTNTTGTVFTGSGITAALAGDYYLNTTTNNIYTCTLSGSASIAKWAYAGDIKANNIIQTASGTATAITLTNVTLVNGFLATFIVATNNNGAATTINGYPLYKPGGTTAPTLTAGKAVTVWYNGTNFFIKASAEGNAVAEHVLAGEIFSTDADVGLTGTAANIGPTVAETVNLTSQNQEYTIASGFHSGLRKLKAVITNLVAGVIKYGETVGGVVGTFTSDATALARHMLYGRTAYVKGNKITGTLDFKAPNLVYNGSFEKGMGGWAKVSGIANTLYGIDTAHDGSFCMYLKSYGSLMGKITQNFNVISNHKYLVECYFKCSADYVPEDVDDTFLTFGSGYIPLSGINPDQWTYGSTIVLAPSVTTFTLAIFTQPLATGTLYIDSIKVIDLTDSFGMGSEPDTYDMSAFAYEWYDNTISTITTGKLTAFGEEVLQGRTVISGNGYLTTGAMPNNTFDVRGVYVNANYKADGSGHLYIAPTESGYFNELTDYNGYGMLKATDTNYVAANILSGKSIFGLAGSAVAGKRVASGTAASSTSGMAFAYLNDSAVNLYYVTVSGLTFIPSVIIIKYFDGTVELETIYDATSKIYAKAVKLVANYSTYGSVNNSTVKGDTAGAYVYSTGFRLPIYSYISGTAPWSWIAYE